VRGDELVKRAESCLADAHCAVADFTRLYLAAADAGAPSVSCFRLYYGIGMPTDAARARACFERAVRQEAGFAGSSPSLERIFLGLMLLDGQGGAREPDRGKALFVDCYQGNDSGVGAAAEARAKSGAAKPIDFCADIGGTTLDTNQCGAVDLDRANVDAQIALKDLATQLALDDVGLALWRAAEKAWGGFASADASYIGDANRGGSMRTMVETSVVAGHLRERPEVLRALVAAKAVPKGAEARLVPAHAHALSLAPDAENRKLLAESDAAWSVYRAAELAFVRHAFAAKYGGAEAAARAAGAELARRRAKELDELK
jgi:uncharacterized protein YecT (DUF1311 family)